MDACEMVRRSAAGQAAKSPPMTPAEFEAWLDAKPPPPRESQIVAFLVLTFLVASVCGALYAWCF